jgi:hypothetical protein
LLESEPSFALLDEQDESSDPCAGMHFREAGAVGRTIFFVKQHAETLFRTEPTFGQWLLHTAFTQTVALHELTHLVVAGAKEIAVNAAAAEGQILSDRLLPLTETPKKAMPHPNTKRDEAESGHYWDNSCFGCVLRYLVNPQEIQHNQAPVSSTEFETPLTRPVTCTQSVHPFLYMLLCQILLLLWQKTRTMDIRDLSESERYWVADSVTLLCWVQLSGKGN